MVIPVLFSINKPLYVNQHQLKISFWLRYCYNYFDFGLKILIASVASIKAPSIKSIQYGTAGKTASRHSLILFGLPGRLMIKLSKHIPAVWRDKIADWNIL